MIQPLRVMAQIIGGELSALPAPVQAFHRAALPARFAGRVDVEPAEHPLARLLARLIGLPTREQHGALVVEVQPTAEGERWTRQFDGRQMSSSLTADGALLIERLGPLRLVFRLHAAARGIRWQLRSLRLFGLPLPRALAGDVWAQESAEGGHYHFDVGARLPLIGLLVAYRGRLEVEFD